MTDYRGADASFGQAKNGHQILKKPVDAKNFITQIFYKQLPRVETQANGQHLQQDAGRNVQY